MAFTHSNTMDTPDEYEADYHYVMHVGEPA